MTSTWSVDRDRQILERDGRPWFLLGDTAWELFRRLDPDQAREYLRVRAGQGFNTVLAVAVSEFDARTVPNTAGDLPFVDDDPGQPNEAFWRHVDAVVTSANGYGLTVGLLPTWGTHWHDGSVPFLDPSSAHAFGGWIAARYQHNDIIWVLGGDRPIETSPQRETVDAMAAGIRAVVGARQLLTFHPPGRASSADFLADTGWVDFDMIQSGHAGLTTPNYEFVTQDLARHGARPTLDAEPNYEDHPVMSPTWKPLPEWRFDDRDVRRAAYHAVFAGACGHVYGAHPVWQMYQPGLTEPINSPARSWAEAMTLPGAEQMRHLAAFATAVTIGSWTPDQRVLHAGIGVMDAHQATMVRRDEPGVLAYLPRGRAVELDLRRWPDRPWRAHWFDPRTGEWQDTAPIAGGRVRVPHPFPGEDAVLLLEPEASTQTDEIPVHSSDSPDQTAGSR
jgi:hypothetical protein